MRRQIARRESLSDTHGSAPREIGMHARRAPQAKRVEFARKSYEVTRGDIANIVGTLATSLPVADVDRTHAKRRTLNQRST